MLVNSFDTKFYHSGTNSFIDHSGTGALNFRSNNGFGFACSTSGGETAMQIVKNGGIKLYQNNSSNANSDLRLETTSGGIDISGSTDGVLNLDTTDGRGSFIRFKENGTVKGYVGCSEGLGLGDQDDISLRATDRVFIQTGGSSETMRLGRSGSHAQVFVNCTVTFSNAVFSIQTNGTCVIGTKATATNTQKHLSFRNPNGEVGQIVTGSNSTTYDTTSDYRLKENEVAISDGITRLKTLKPYRFNFKNTPSEILDGFYAHEVMTVVPQAVVGKKDEVDSNGDPKYQGIDHSMIVPLLVAALQEAIGRIEALEAS